MRWRVAALLFIILAAGVAVGTLILSPDDQRPGAVPTGRLSEHFSTLPPQSELPSAAQCATRVRSNPIPENKGVNTAFNRATGHSVGELFPASDDPRANREISSRIDGQFTGSTAEILRWAACKWGIDEDIVAAQAAVESWWRQTNLGDFGTDPAACPPGHGLGVDGVGGKCPQSYGILQNRYPYERATWPGIAASTAMNADTAYGIWRACFEGFELWLNDVDRVGQYAAGDAWGCVGRWYAGRWHTPAADSYVTKVKDYLDRRTWQEAGFQEP